MKKLKDLIECSFDVDIVGIADDSRLVKPGFLFVATKGFNVDHFDYIEDAISNGAVAIIADRSVPVDVALIIVDDVDELFPVLCQRFYDVDVRELKLIGITGTDGKTTTASIIRQLMLPSIDIAYIGTNGLDVSNRHFDTNNTTPCISELYECFSKIKMYGCKMVVMEVSSEALLHNRIAGLEFDVVAFTNITEDHLNIHGTIENYRNSKFLLVNYLKKEGIIFLNFDDDNCRMLTDKRVSTYGISADSDFTFFDVKFSENLAEFSIRDNGSLKVYKVVSPLCGKYNVYNVGLAFIICLSIGGVDAKLLDNIRNLKVISGRSERVKFGQNFDIVLDYAHTYNGISNILDSVRDYKRIITVTGAAGGREKEKRAKIGKMVLEKSDIVVFTMDDPRYEAVDDIIDDMLEDTSRENYLRINDRMEAIYKAFDMAECGDIVLVLGKGRDNYMAIDDKKIPYCDYDVICNYFRK